ncbi:MAG: hypothetical protein ACI9T7_000980 [Oleiphilaceae bacterium]|jgi:hypothetical protein
MMVAVLQANAITDPNNKQNRKWFATKHMLRITIAHSLIAIVRMKKTR